MADREENVLLPDGQILRHGNGERIVHWAIAIVFLFLFLSGLALFSPLFFWLSFLFGGGQFMRFLHPIAGVALVLLFYPYAWRLRRDNHWSPVDTNWAQNMLAYMRKEAHFPDTGKYNAGQKLMYWSMIPVIGVLLVTGIALWQPWFAPSFSPGIRRASGLLHAAMAFVMFIGIGVHWYAAYWTKGSIRSMVRGKVTRAWARFHHPGWYKHVTGKDA